MNTSGVHASLTFLISHIKIDEKAILIYLLVFERKELRLEADQERRAWMQAEARPRIASRARAASNREEDEGKQRWDLYMTLARLGPPVSSLRA
jgi:hypothetical protein